MCTVTWTYTEDGYCLFCNRDERRTRAIASAPRVEERDGVRYLAPLDSESGGTWIAVNEFGLTLCLLNGAVLNDNAGPAAGSRSRGLALLDLIASPSANVACSRFRRMDLKGVAAFTLVALDLNQPAAVTQWDRSGKMLLSSGDPLLPLASSSIDPAGVKQTRRDEFNRRPACRGSMRRDELIDFHRSHGPAPDAYSTCMHRADAQTVSFSMVRLDHERVDFLYCAGAPCQAPPARRETLPLAGRRP